MTTMTKTEKTLLHFIIYDVLVSMLIHIIITVCCLISYLVYFYSQTQVLLVSVDQFSTLCTMAIKHAHMQRRENDLNWMLELVSTTSNNIGYRVYPQTMVLSEIDTYRLLDLALLHASEENKRQTRPRRSL